MPNESNSFVNLSNNNVDSDLVDENVNSDDIMKESEEDISDNLDNRL